MIAVVQRVTEASVTVGGEVVGRIGGGLVVLVAVDDLDELPDVAWTAGKLTGLRVFRSGDKHFDLDVRAAGVAVETGRFGADMSVALVNDGPATFIIDSSGTVRSR